MSPYSHAYSVSELIVYYVVTQLGRTVITVRMHMQNVTEANAKGWRRELLIRAHARAPLSNGHTHTHRPEEGMQRQAIYTHGEDQGLV